MFTRDTLELLAVSELDEQQPLIIFHQDGIPANTHCILRTL